MKKILLITIGILMSTTFFSQIQLTQFFLDGLNYNPAFAGSKYAICTNLYGRQQWLGLIDAENNSVAPSSLVFNIHAPLYSLHSGIGLNVVSDKFGFEKNIGAKLDYAYRLPLNNEKSDLGVGIALSLLNKTIDFDKLIIIQQADPLIKFNQSESGLFADIDLGIFYQEVKKFYVGVSINNLIESTAKIGNINYLQKRNMYFTSSYQLKLSNNNQKPLYLIPSVLVKSNFLNAQFDLNARLEYNNKFWGGVSYRYQDAVALFAGVNIKGFQIGASYDVTIGEFLKISKGSPEVFIGYCYLISPKVKLTNLYNTRYL